MNGLTNSRQERPFSMFVFNFACAEYEKHTIQKRIVLNGLS
jgi:hypothetical protein